MFYDRRYVATPIGSPDFVKLTEAHGLLGIRVTDRSQVDEAVSRAREYEGTAVIEFVVAPEDNVYPMVPAGQELGAMLRRPEHTPTPSRPDPNDAE